MSDIDFLVDSAIDQMIDNTINSLIAGYTNAVTTGVAEAVNRLRRLGSFRAIAEAKTQQMWEEIGKNAQRSMQSAYGQLVTAREGAASRTHYRAGSGRLAGGVLRTAIGRSDFYQADSHGLSFGNRSVLDGAARHWHRIAFGAGGRGKGADDTFDVRFRSQTIGSISLNEEPSPSFSMPAGVWIGPGGGRVRAGASAPGTDAFYPQRIKVGGAVVGRGRPRGIMGRPTGLRPTRGIAGADFFAAGLRRIASDIPIYLDKLFKEVMEEITAQVGGAMDFEVTNRET